MQFSIFTFAFFTSTILAAQSSEQTIELSSPFPLFRPSLSFLLKEILLTSFLHKKMDTFLTTNTPLTFKKARAKTTFYAISLVFDSGEKKR